MSIYSIPPLLGSLLAISIGIFVYLKNRKSEINVAFALFSLSLFLWLFSYAVAYSVEDHKIALFWCRLACTAVIFTAPTFYHLAVCYLKIKNEKKFVYLSYLIMIIFAFLFRTEYFLRSELYKYFWGFYSKAGPLHPVYLLIFVLVCGRSFILIWNAYRQRREISPLESLRLKYIFIAYFIAVLAFIDYIPKYGFEIYPFGWIFSVFFAIITSYAILRHQLLDIEVVIKKTLVFAGTFVFAFGVFVAVTLLVSQFFGGGRLISLAISSLIIVIGLRPIETWLINSTNKFLFQKKYEYKEIIKAFIDNVVTELNLDTVISSTLKLLDETLHPYVSSVFILNKTEDKYQLYNSLRFENTSIIFTSESKLVTFLKRTHNPAVIRQINGIAGVNPEIASEMANLKAVIVLPLMLHNDLIGFISLGRKKSDEDYSKDDLDVLSDLARTESIAVANAQLITEAAQSERRAAIGTMAAGINHEIGNPLNTMATRIQVFKLSRRKGMFKDKPVEEVLDQAEAVLDECLEQLGRISEITKKLANFAKPSKEFKPVLVKISEEIDETLAIVGHDLELERIKIEKNILQGLPRILADQREIQQILFNLIRNAGQAIEGTGTITIRAFLTFGGKVRIEIQDTGEGIPEDKKQRIFEPFFTTKGANKGTGLGLSIVRQLVWRNKGEISFTSEVGKGTTFILEFPKGE